MLGTTAMWRGLRRLPGLTLGLAAPGVVVLVGMLVVGAVDVATGLLAIIAILMVAVAFAIPRASSWRSLREAIDRFGPDFVTSPEPAAPAWARVLSPAVDALWTPLLRLSRAWRSRINILSSRLNAAEAVIAAVPNPLILIDRNRRIVGANPASTEFVGQVTEPRDLAVSLRNPAVLAAADSVLQGNGARIVEFGVSVPVARMLEARFARIEQPTPEGAAAILTLYDVTALKRAEQMRADFIANAGHELKTPLATLIGFIETLLGPARADEAARERFLGIMHQQAGRMARLVDDLLSLSRIELNEHVAPIDHVELAPVIEHVAEALELRAAARGMAIDLSLPLDFPEVLGDRDELAQVFQNLLDNAIKYGKPNSEVSVSTVMPAVPQNMVGIAVTDRGDGIPSEHLPRLTERFYRVDSARSRELGGTGLGLAIVKHILNRHRGRLDIASAPGAGSTFTVWLRAAETSDAARSPN
jgi:two-component system phosphate regulon sensor histidine kinase PhoR